MPATTAKDEGATVKVRLPNNTLDYLKRSADELQSSLDDIIERALREAADDLVRASKEPPGNAARIAHTVPVKFRLDRRWHAGMERLAAEAGLSLGDMMNDALEEFVASDGAAAARTRTAAFAFHRMGEENFLLSTLEGVDVEDAMERADHMLEAARELTNSCMSGAVPDSDFVAFAAAILTDIGRALYIASTRGGEA